MATIYWEGQADAVAGVETGSIDSVDGTPANNTFTVTLGGESISQVGDTDVATTAAALVVLLNASTNPYFSAVTWTNPSAGNIVGTADTAGVPFVAALTETGAGTGAVTDFAETLASSGPHDWSTAANWSGGAVPVADDIVWIDDTSVNICWGLAQSAVDLDELHITQNYRGRIGLRYYEFATSANGETTVATKPEYRATALDIETTLLDVGEHFGGVGNPTGSGRINLDIGDHACTATIHNTSRTPTDTGQACVRLLFNQASSSLHIRKAPGGVGIATDLPGEVSTIGTVTVTDDTAESIVQAKGATITTWNQRGGTCHVTPAATVTTVNVDGGTLTTEGSQAITTMNMSGGTTYPNSTGTITTLNLNGGEADFSRSAEARTVTTTNIGAGASLVFDKDVLTQTNKPASNEARVVRISCAEA